jgi:hypothetical protein
MSDLSDSLLRGGMILPTGDMAKNDAIWQKFCFLQVLCCTKESRNIWVDYTSVIAFFQKLI